jgi:hypothetical protein
VVRRRSLLPALRPAEAIRVLHAERLDGISASTYVIVLSNATVWAAWSLFTGERCRGTRLDQRPSRDPDLASVGDRSSQRSYHKLRWRPARTDVPQSVWGPGRNPMEGRPTGTLGRGR